MLMITRITNPGFSITKQFWISDFKIIHMKNQNADQELILLKKNPSNIEKQLEKENQWSFFVNKSRTKFKRWCLTNKKGESVTRGRGALMSLTRAELHWFSPASWLWCLFIYSVAATLLFTFIFPLFLLPVTSLFLRNLKKNSTGCGLPAASTPISVQKLFYLKRIQEEAANHRHWKGRRKAKPTPYHLSHHLTNDKYILIW